MFGIKAILSTLILAAIPSSQDATLIFMTTPGCGPCRQIAPLIEELAREGYAVETVDASQHPDIARQLQVDRFPTLLMLSDDRIVDRVVGGGDPVVVRPRIMKMFDRAAEARRKNSRQNEPQPSVAVAEAKTAASVSTQILPDSGISAISENFSAFPDSLQNDREAANESADHLHRKISPWITSSVKLRVDSQHSHSWGTGTIVDTRNGEALIVTCGHIFRDSKGQEPVEVHLYGTHSTAKAYGRCIFHDLEIDLAFIAIKPPFPVQAVPIAPPVCQVRSGEQVWSVGCDGGANPTVKPHQIMSLDRIGTPRENALPFHYIQVSGAPVSGRSGGGLFTGQGYLIGICNTGDPKENDGHFVPSHIIRHVLKQMKLEVVYENPSLIDRSLLADANSHSISVATPTDSIAETRKNTPDFGDFKPLSMQMPEPIQTASFSSSDSFSSSESAAKPELSGMTGIEQATLDEIKRRTQDGDEVILIVRSRRNPEIPSDVIVLNGTSDQFLSVLTNQSYSNKNPSYNPVILSSHEPDAPLQPLTTIDENASATGRQAVSFPVFHGIFDGR